MDSGTWIIHLRSGAEMLFMVDVMVILDTQSINYQYYLIKSNQIKSNQSISIHLRGVINKFSEQKLGVLIEGWAL